MLPTKLDHREVVKMALAKAGGLRKMCNATGIARTTICDFMKRRTYALQNRTVEKLVGYLNG